MANRHEVIQQITRESLLILTNSLSFAKTLDHDHEQEFGKKNYEIGDTLKVRKPYRFVGGDGPAFEPEALADQFVLVTVDQYSKVHWQTTSMERALEFNAIKERVLKPAGVALANKIDRICLQKAYQGLPFATGTPGTVPTTALTYLTAGQMLDEMAVPLDEERYIVMSPAMNANAVDNFKALFNEQALIAKQYRTGRMGVALGFDWAMNQQVYPHQGGTYAGSGRVNGGTQTGSSLVTENWTSGQLAAKKGDVFTIAGVYAVNPQSRLPIPGRLMQFTLTDDVADTTGAATLPIYPAIIPSGQYQNVDSIPADHAAITFSHTSGYLSPQGMAYHRNAFTLVSVPLEAPNSGVVESYTETDPDTGIKLRYIMAYDAVQDRWISRLECLWGFAVVYHELALRIQS